MNLKKGFTLIELLIVIAIIGILAVAFLPQLLGAPAKARDTQRMADLKKLEAFLVDHSLTEGSLPETGCVGGGEEAEEESSSAWFMGTAFADSVSEVVNSNVADFGGNTPSDPDGTNPTPGCTGGYGYIKFDNGANDYSAALYVLVEVEENANLACEAIHDKPGAANNTLNLDGSGLSADGDNCHVVLIQ